MNVTILDEDDTAFEVDVQRYERDADYRSEIHEKLQIEDWQGPLDWDYLFASVEELRAMGQKPAFDSGDYPNEEAVTDALDKFLDDIWKEVLREREAKNRVGAVRTQGST
jgi:hypothetical protein